MEKLRGIMSKSLRVPVEKIGDQATMKDIAGWDSLTHMDLIFAIEENFEVQFTGDEIAEMQSVPMILKMLEQRGAL